MENLVLKLRQDYPQFSFVAGKAMCWSPQDNQILYSPQDGSVGLLHELGHAQLRHHQYASDLDLLQKEVSAWQEAFKLAEHYEVSIDKDHAEDCLDTYRDWLYKRSLCPECGSSGLQASLERYECLNCRHSWQVTAARFCRPYRRSKTISNAKAGSS